MGLISFLKSFFKKKPIRFYLSDIIEKKARNIDNFFFIQIGAHDGVSDDLIHNLIIKYKWKGILIEPVKYLFEKLVENYNHCKGLIFENLAISDKNEYRNFYRLKRNNDNLPVIYDMIGSFSREHVLKHKRIPNIEKYLICERIKCISFSELIKKHSIRKIDLLHIDAEGFDYEIIKTIDFDIIKPFMIFFENVHLNEKDKIECFGLLRSEGYKVVSKGINSLAWLDGKD